MYGDTTVQALHYAIGGLAQRADVRAHNLANLNTPGFRAEEVDFASHLRDALRTDDVAAANAPTTQPTATFPDASGNTVDLETEMTGMMKDELLRSAMVNAVNSKTSILRTAISGQSR